MHLPRRSGWLSCASAAPSVGGDRPQAARRRTFPGRKAGPPAPSPWVPPAETRAFRRLALEPSDPESSVFRRDSADLRGVTRPFLGDQPQEGPSDRRHGCPESAEISAGLVARPRARAASSIAEAGRHIRDDHERRRGPGPPSPPVPPAPGPPAPPSPSSTCTPVRWICEASTTTPKSARPG